MNKELKDMHNTFHAMRILFALYRNELLYNEIQKDTKLKPAQLEQALELLSKHFLIILCTMPKKDRNLVRYKLSKHGAIALECIDAILWKV